jgi:integrase
MKLSAAREAASDVLRACRAGKHPREARKVSTEAAERQGKNTFAAVAEEFITQHVTKLRSKSRTEAEIRRYLIVRWGDRPISTISADDVGELIRQIVHDGKPHMARLLLAHTKRLFRWAAAPGRSRLKTNPCLALSAKKDFDIAVTPRQLALSHDHLRLIWKTAKTLGGPFFRMLLLTGQRRSEVAEMTWGELDLDNERVWNIPATRMKAKRPHEIPLTPEMVVLLKDLREHRGSGDFVFSTSLGERPISGFSKVKGRLDKSIAEMRGDAEKRPSPRLDDPRHTPRGPNWAWRNPEHSARHSRAGNRACSTGTGTDLRFACLSGREARSVKAVGGAPCAHRPSVIAGDSARCQMSAALDRLTSEAQERFAAHKVRLIACLREAWNRGPRETPFDPERAWWLTESIIAAATTPSSTTASDRRAQAVELAKAFGDARKALDRTIQMRPDLAWDFMCAWAKLGGASAATTLFDQSGITARLAQQLQQAVDGVAKLEATANCGGSGFLDSRIS